MYNNMYINTYIHTLNKENTKLENEIEGIEKMCHLSIPLDLILAIDDWTENDLYGKHHNSRTSAIKELLRIGLWFAKKRKQFETIFNDPELMQELQTQLKEGGLVDFAERMNWQEFQIVWSIFRNEAKVRKLEK